MAVDEPPPQAPPSTSPPPDPGRRPQRGPIRLALWGGVVLALLGIWSLTTPSFEGEFVEQNDNGLTPDSLQPQSRRPPPPIVEPLRQSMRAEQLTQRAAEIRRFGVQQGQAAGSRPSLRGRDDLPSVGRRRTIFQRHESVQRLDASMPTRD